MLLAPKCVCMLCVKHRLSSAWCNEWILCAVPQSDWQRVAGHLDRSWLATMKDNLLFHNLGVEDATELALDMSLWRLLAASGATHWNGASQTMMMMWLMIVSIASASLNLMSIHGWMKGQLATAINKWYVVFACWLSCELLIVCLCVFTSGRQQMSLQIDVSDVDYEMLREREDALQQLEVWTVVCFGFMV